MKLYANKNYQRCGPIWIFEKIPELWENKFHHLTITSNNDDYFYSDNYEFEKMVTNKKNWTSESHLITQQSLKYVLDESKSLKLNFEVGMIFIILYNA